MCHRAVRPSLRSARVLFSEQAPAPGFSGWPGFKLLPRGPGSVRWSTGLRAWSCQCMSEHRRDRAVTFFFCFDAY